VSNQSLLLQDRLHMHLKPLINRYHDDDFLSKSSSNAYLQSKEKYEESPPLDCDPNFTMLNAKTNYKQDCMKATNSRYQYILFACFGYSQDN
jgi:hypothetical protein